MSKPKIENKALQMGEEREIKVPSDFKTAYFFPDDGTGKPRTVRANSREEAEEILKKEIEAESK